MTLCQLWYWFSVLRNFENHHSEKLLNICGGVSLYSNHFSTVRSKFTYDSQAYDLMKLYFEILPEILASSQFKFYTIYSKVSVLPKFLYSNRLINISDIFHYFCESKILKIIICLFIRIIINFLQNYATRSAEHVQNLVFYFHVS